MSGHNRPSIGTANSGDMGARLSHLADVVARSAGTPASGLPVVFHECVGAGAMRDRADDGTVLLTFVTAEGQSHVFAVARPVAEGLRDEMRNLRTLVHVDVLKAQAVRRSPIPKPGGRLL
ncbi:MAG: hypothetical protein K0R17_2256 [Rariglobus sp.]|jgi:hypothetical protein|nr:hypothetical protein [Microvirga sp.]MDF3058041.1 hypothetical protein [Rariglobus sp.]